MRKLTKDQLTSILSRRIIDCTKEEIECLFALCGFKAKEYSVDSRDSSVTFEMHYEITYVARVYAEKGVRVVGISNEYIKFNGDDVQGLSVVLDNIGDLLVFIMNLMPRMRMKFDGPRLDMLLEDYDDEATIDQLIKHINSIIFAPAT